MLLQLAWLMPLAFICEVIDSSLGMMYGTLLSPLLIGMGFNPLLVVPSILISQAAGGLAGTIRHHKFKNADFSGLTRDTKVVLSIIIPGIFAVFLGIFVAISIPSLILKTYIGLLVIAMGILCLRPIKYGFAWWKMYMVGLLASFNKALSGGGFGPVTTTGKVLGGLGAKVSIATTTYAEVPICVLAFALYLVFKGMINPPFPLLLCIGSITGGLVGPTITYRIKIEPLRNAVGVLAILTGIWVLVKTFIF